VNLKKILSLSLGLVVLATVAVLTGTGTVGASPHIKSVIAAPPPTSIPVNVTNTPLPVSIGGTPTVNATINGTPSVNVASLPAISATLTNSSITVGNPATDPVPVHDVNDPAANPYSATACFSPSGTGGCLTGNNTVTVPSVTLSNQPVKQLVIEFVSGSCYSVTGGEIFALELLITPPSGIGPTYQTQYSAFLVPVQTLNANGNIEYVYSQQTRLYALPGSTVVLYAGYNTQATTEPPPLFCQVNMQGHFATQ
jgi:hypothetical protein